MMLIQTSKLFLKDFKMKVTNNVYKQTANKSVRVYQTLKALNLRNVRIERLRFFLLRGSTLSPTLVSSRIFSSTNQMYKIEIRFCSIGF